MADTGVELENQFVNESDKKRQADIIRAVRDFYNGKKQPSQKAEIIEKQEILFEMIE